MSITSFRRKDILLERDAVYILSGNFVAEIDDEILQDKINLFFLKSTLEWFRHHIIIARRKIDRRCTDQSLLIEDTVVQQSLSKIIKL